MRRFMEAIALGRLNTRPLATLRFRPDAIFETYDQFAI